MNKLEDAVVVAMYVAGEKVATIQARFGCSRPAVYECLRRNGVDAKRKGSVELVCHFCQERFTRIRYRVEEGVRTYCSVECFHADRSMHGSLSERGYDIDSLIQESTGKTSRSHGRLARQVFEACGIELKPGQVIHHIDGCKWNNHPDNLMLFDSHSAHMKFHHKLRNYGNKVCAKKRL
jgi:hypothetical protein